MHQVVASKTCGVMMNERRFCGGYQRCEMTSFFFSPFRFSISPRQGSTLRGCIVRSSAFRHEILTSSERAAQRLSADTRCAPERQRESHKAPVLWHCFPPRNASRCCPSPRWRSARTRPSWTRSRLLRETERGGEAIHCHTCRYDADLVRGVVACF